MRRQTYHATLKAGAHTVSRYQGIKRIRHIERITDTRNRKAQKRRVPIWNAPGIIMQLSCHRYILIVTLTKQPPSLPLAVYVWQQNRCRYLLMACLAV